MPKRVNIVKVDIRTGAVLESRLESMYWQHYWSLERFESQAGLLAGKEVQKRLGDGEESVGA